MDEPKRDNEQVSDSELFDVTVRRDDTKSLDETMPEEAVLDEGMEKTIPETTAETHEVEAAPFEEEKIEEVKEPVKEEEPIPVVAAPVATQPEAPVIEAHKPHGNSGGVLVLQWLSYAFWGWFGLSMAILSGITIGFFLNGTGASDAIGEGLAYPLAAVIVMLIISLVTDFFYARHEPAPKTGAANIIMLIHVVLYLLVTVGAFVTIVFAFISMLLSETSSYGDNHNAQKIAMLTAAVTAVIFGGLSARALFGGRKGGVRKFFWLIMSALALVAIVASIAGPAMRISATRDDRLIESALPSLASNIQEYARTNDKLPASLNDVQSLEYSTTTKENIKQMINKGLVTYKPNTKPATTDPNTVMPLDDTSGTKTKTPNQGVSAPVSGGQKRFYYQLCVVYKEEKNSDYYNRYEAAGASMDYENSTVTTYSHPKGEKCYDLVASGKYSYY
jgi:type II secretory pathway pseudopilin PulG